eukprot:snap_masked-scaffold_2-processed-gene-3.31-mRNA-1 protein AED:1.00 eAED:1.00 QI:0/-1/0/0/-1/1/1/0/74
MPNTLFPENYLRIMISVPANSTAKHKTYIFFTSLVRMFCYSNLTEIYFGVPKIWLTQRVGLLLWCRDVSFLLSD